MKTDDLITALATDAQSDIPPLQTLWHVASGAAIVVAAVSFLALLGPRPDFAAVLHSPRFLFKFVVTLALAASVYPAIVALSRPGGDLRRMAWLCAAPVLLAVSVATELALVPSALWEARLIGSNSSACLASISIMGAAPLAVFLAVLRSGAPTHPVLAGAAAGLLAGAVAATFYAAHCPDDSPLFVATWYTLAIAGLAAVGAIVAPRVARW